MTAKKRSSRAKRAKQRDPDESRYDGMSLAKLQDEAKERQIVVTKGDGSIGEPEKEEYVAALKAADVEAAKSVPFVGDPTQPFGDGHAHGNDHTNPQRDSFGIPQAKGKQTGGPRQLARAETQEERDARAEDEGERTIEVRATRRGEYPVGVLREAGARFGFIVPEDADDDDREKGEYQLPSWLEAVEEEYETKRKPAFA